MLSLSRTCIASIVRLVYLAKIDYNDVTYTSVAAVLMTAIEPSLAVMLACIPLLRPLLGHTRRSDPVVHSAKKSVGFSTWMSSTWSRSKTFNSSKKKSTTTVLGGGGDGSRSSGSRMVRLESTEAPSANQSRAAMIRYDSDDAMELRYILSPAEGVSHHARVEVVPAAVRERAGGDEVVQQQVQHIEGTAHSPQRGSIGGIAILVKQEWNVEHEQVVGQ